MSLVRCPVKKKSLKSITIDVQLLGEQVQKDGVVLLGQRNVAVDLGIGLQRRGGSTSQAEQNRPCPWCHVLVQGPSKGIRQKIGGGYIWPAIPLGDGGDHGS